MHAEIRQLLVVLDQAYNRKSWHGTNLRGAIRGLTPADAVWRPAPGRHNIQELVVHAAYWKYAAWRRLLAGKRGAFPLTGSNFFERTDADAASLRQDIALLERMHTQLRETVASTAASRLRLPLPGSQVTRLSLITGVAAHDLYHAGQMQLIKALMAGRR